MELRLISRTLAVFASLAALCFTPATAHAQVVGENINMVSGTQWPGGDPFLQRQNEPTMAVSSVNGQHLMAGANDYRSVDVPDPAFGEMAAGDAWLGVFKSLDGGQTWKSVLLPGYPQDKSADGRNSPLKATMKVPATFNLDSTQRAQIGKVVTLPGSADPVMRAGTDGMFYFLGINFARDRSVSRLFLGRFVDQNNKENGDATKGTDPILYIDTQIIARSTDTGLNGGKQIFIDKPWMVVDVPRDTTHTCTVPDPEKPATATTPAGTKKILAGTIYVGWAQFAPLDVSSDIMLTSSVNCGVSWSTPRKLNTVNSKVNQGVALGIEPLTGRLIVAWRRVAAGKQTDAIMATRANARKKPFAAPRVVAKLVPFDLGTGLGQARTQTMPSMAVSSDGKVSYVHLAWAARDGVGGPSRIWMSSAKIVTPPNGDQDQDEPDDYEPETRVKWTAAAKVAIGKAIDDVGHELTRGHQYMPSITASQGKLALFYYDSRQDHTRRYYEPYPVVDDPLNPGQKIWVPDSKGKFYKEVLGPIGDLVEGTKGGLVFGNTPGADFNDAVLERTRHTIDVRVGFASPGLNPSFSSELVSRFPFGLSGAETNYDWTKSPAVKQDMTVWSFGALAGTNPNPVAGGLLIMTKDAVVQQLQQLQLNAPGYPMFKGASAAFMGDYIDIQGQNFVVSRTSATGWAYNTGSSSAPVFHAVWTSNQDVKAPPYDPVTGRPDWTRYTPVTLLANGTNGTALFDGGRTSPNISNPNAPVGVCDPASTGSRDQNIYTARITEGLQVTTPQNSKFLNGQKPVGFVIAASNSTGNPMTVTFGTPRIDPTGSTLPPVSYTTDFTSPVLTVTADIAPYSSVYRTLFVVQGSTLNSAPTLLVTVTESAGCGTTGKPACRTGSITFNPPIAISSLVAPEGATNPAAGEAYAATIGAPNISNPNISNPNISNPNISNPNISNPNISNPNISNPNISNPNISNPNISNPNISNPNISNPNISNPNISNPNISNSALSDASYTFTNTGNTNASYFVKVVGDAAQAPKPLQLIVTKTYKTPSAVGCDLKEVAHDQLVVSVPDINGAIVAPTDPVSTGVGTPNISNATLALAPGETATVTLRGYVPVAEMAKTVAALTPAPVPASAPPTPVQGNPTFETWGTVAGNASFVKVPTQTSLTAVGNLYSAAVIYNPNLANPPGGLGGTISFIVGPDVVAVLPVTGPSTSFSPAVPLAPGQTMVATYSGDVTFAPSSSNAYVAPIQQLAIGVRQSNLSTLTVYLQDGSTGQDIGDATVTVNGTAGVFTDLDGSFGYVATFSSPKAGGSPMNIQVTTISGQTATVTGTFLAPPSITSPAYGATFDRAGPVAVAWTPTTGAEYTLHASTSIAPAPASVVLATNGYTYPGGTFVVGEDVYFGVWATTPLTYTGAVVIPGFGPYVEVSGGWSYAVAVAPTLYMNGTVSYALNGIVAAPSRSFWVSVKDPVTQAVLPNSEISVALTSIADPTGPNLPNPQFIGWYAPGGYFAASSLSLAPGDTVKAFISRTVNGTVVARSTCRVTLPGVASITSMTMPGSTAGLTVTALWDYPASLPNPQNFWIWPSVQGTNPVPTAGPTDREMWYTAFGAPPFTAEITSINIGATCDGDGSGSIAARTDDNVAFPVTVVP